MLFGKRERQGLFGTKRSAAGSYFRGLAVLPGAFELPFIDAVGPFAGLAFVGQDE
jgi:hypothetical protein